MKLRILVIDDDESIRFTVGCHLEDLGHEVITAEEPLACAVYHGGECDHEHPCCDMLLVDYHMPRMNGLEFIEHMEKKGCKGLTRNKVIMSGALPATAVARAEKLGCRLYRKPFSFQELDSLIAEVLPTIPPDRQLANLQLDGNGSSQVVKIKGRDQGVEVK